MEIILYLSVALIAIAFLVLVIYLSRTLKSLQTTMESVSSTLTGLETQMQGITTETTLLLHKTNALAEDIQHKSENLNTVVDAVKGVGGSIQRVNQTIDQITNRVQLAASQNDEKITQVVQWGNACIELVNKWKKHKAEQSTAIYTESEAGRDVTLPSQETRYQRSQS
ncbi:DUF948 domain-containing protein [Pradoshia sp. D12]|uniref:DUF948 domain-containing protein n=1 Tax=Bacillaceae TaxID=186817 RepID=UPI00080AD9BD|nr:MULTISPECIES: DUF948 domain-containing protein [Bacillaceae]OCA81868.1 general stress protein [Bacillus sp. FJAT-27986]QFK72541.1 DUF948 domain-containing protein [Pradoshia sp. D12]TPF70715.1 DUF948 domain-containing protein [Bacillus sp. D12]